MLLAVGAVAVAINPASAAGKSETKYGCYTEWWNTAWAQKCPGGAEVVGYYKSTVTCSVTGDRSITVSRFYLPDSRTVSGPDCMFSVSNGRINYLGYY